MAGLGRLAKAVDRHFRHHRLTVFWLVAALSFVGPWGYVFFRDGGQGIQPAGEPAGFARIDRTAYMPYDGQGLRLVFIDVGQGDATLIRQGECAVLIDGGPRGDTVLDDLRSRGITDLDLVIATHPHADHIGGLPAVFSGLNIDMVWYNLQDHRSQTFRRFYQGMRSRAGNYKAPLRGELWSCGEMMLEVLHPPRTAQGFAGHVHELNIAVRVVYQDFAAIISGDLEKAGELDIINAGFVLRSQVLELGHHGSRTSTHPDWVEAVGPELAIIQVGRNNKYGHPHAEVIEFLEESNIPYLTTATHGTLVVQADQNGSFSISSYPDKGF
ncbi:MAG: ComEC/Rec2 family competence protein [Desulfovermiculus sp.]